MNMGAIFRTWLNVLTKPGEQVFEDERAVPQATLGTAVVMILIVGVISALFAIIRGWVFRAQFAAMGGMDAFFSQANLPPEVQQQLQMIYSAVFTPAVGFTGAVFSIFFSIIGFLIFVGILYLVARALGGVGEFGRYAYLNAAFVAPVTIISALLSFIPVLGGCLSLFLVIYEIVLCYFATKVEHQLTSGRAIITVLSPLILAVILVSCFGVALGGVIVSFMNQ